ncbi:hypothetical protein HDU77_000708 [Chytriomyces hyalinus]|nr:hypothetical protein HDU77_000708 [Chytriomyces hyalinus]
MREESHARRRSSISRAVSNSGSLDPDAEQLFPRNQLLEESLPAESLGSRTRTDAHGVAAAAADWIQSSSSSTTRLQDLHSTQPSILDASFNAGSTIAEFADGGFRGISEPAVMNDARFENALRKRRASGTTGGSIGVLALAAEAELQRQITMLQSNESHQVG